MKINPRIARLGVALTVTTIIGLQIPTRSGLALADSYDVVDVNTNGGKVVAAAGGLTLLSLLGVVPFGEKVSEGFQSPFAFESYVGVKPIAFAVSVVNNPDGGATPSAGSGNAASASLLATSTGTARELIDRCPELAKMLESEGPFTMFLPSDAALASVKLDGTKLEALLKRHIVLGRYSYSDLSNLSEGAKLQTLAETELTVTHDGDKVLVGGATVPNDAHAGSNGVSFTIDGLL